MCAAYIIGIAYISYGGDYVDGLEARRKAAGLTQAALAHVIGVSQTSIAAWEAGGSYPKADKLPAIAAALSCTIDDLYNVPA